ncbi:MAG: response regulator transcription factor [bacterium]
MNLMIVDDNQKMRQMIRNLFSDMFDSMTECSSGEEAIDIYEEILPNWVLMDIKMKNVNGISATRQIIKKHPAAKIIIITQYDDSILKKEAINAGAVHFCNKIDISIIRDFILNKSNSMINYYGAKE